MARKRLLTILAGAVAVIGLQVGSATAFEIEADLGATKVEASVSEDGVEAKVDEDEDGDGTVEAKVSEDGADAKVGDTEVSTEEVTEDPAGTTTEKVEETAGTTTEKVEETAEQVTDTDADGSQPVGGGDDGSSEEGSSEGDDSGSASYEITTAGDARSTRDSSQRPDALDPAQARRFLPGYSGSNGSGGEYSPAFGFSASQGHAFDDPIVAQAPSQGGDWSSVSPEGERSDAELAAIPAPVDGDAVPAGLKLLAGLLVAGTGTLWHLTRRELAPVTTGPRLG